VQCWPSRINGWKSKQPILPAGRDQEGPFHAERNSHRVPVEGDGKRLRVEVGGKRNHDAACFYPDPKPAAKQIKG
jgi:hypothetical protein